VFERVAEPAEPHLAAEADLDVAGVEVVVEARLLLVEVLQDLRELPHHDRYHHFWDGSAFLDRISEVDTPLVREHHRDCYSVQEGVAEGDRLIWCAVEEPV